MQVHVCSGVGNLGLIFVSLFVLQYTCSRVYIDRPIHDFVRHADFASHFPGLQVFQLELSHQGRGTWGGSEVIKDVVGWSSLHHFPCGFQMLLMGVPHHRCILQHRSHKALVAVCLDSSWTAGSCIGAHFLAMHKSLPSVNSPYAAPAFFFFLAFF